MFYFLDKPTIQAPHDNQNHETAAKTLLADHYQCMADYFGDLSNANSLGDLWAQYQPKVQENIRKRKACAAKNFVSRFMYVRTFSHLPTFFTFCLFNFFLVVTLKKAPKYFGPYQNI